MTRLDCREVADLLAAQCERLFLDFVPDAKTSRNELRGHGPDGAVWAMVTRGSKRGVWANWSDYERQRGDCLELVHWARFPDERGRAQSTRWALGWLGLAEAQPDSETVRAARIEASEAAAWRAEREAAERERRMVRAKGIYLHDSRPAAEACEIADYLTTRGLPLDFLQAAPGNLRFTASRWYDASRPAVPAMLAAIVHPIAREHIGTHVTYLDFRDGHWRNVPYRPRRLTFGAKAGGIIPLLRGASGKRRPPEGDVLLLAEGIENALAAAMCCVDAPDLPDDPRVWAAVDLGNFAVLELPPEIHSVILVHDNDNERFGGYRDRVARAWLEEGRSVQHMRPPRGFKDFNDYVATLSARLGTDA
jgi:Toprim domain